jgi:tetratricopeptide (TPR) repeat protein
MLKDNWLDKQLQTTRELITEGGEALNDNRLVDAENKLREASIILDSAETITNEVLSLRLTVFTELAVIATQTGDAATGLKHYLRALEAGDELADRGEPLEMRLGGILVNIGGIYATSGKMDEGIEASRRAAALFDEVEEDERLPLMKAFAAYHLGVCLVGRRDLDEGASVLEDAAARARSMAEGGGEQVLPILVEILTHLARTRAELGDREDAWTLGNEGATVALNLYEDTGSRTNLAQYLQAELDLVSHAEITGRFGHGEDALFRVLDIAGDDPDVVERGKAFYDAVLLRTDEELKQGGLPREEAEESRRELLARIPA